jgi:hypothetical protein
MTDPFEYRTGSYRLRLELPELAVLRSVPAILKAGGDADGRLAYRAHADDEAAEARYQELVADSLDGLRRADRSGFERVVEGESVPAEDVEAFMRVVGEARIVLAGRLGITDDGWEEEADPSSDPELAMLGWLGYLQDAAVRVLTAGL